jgi:hypothetical protein
MAKKKKTVKIEFELTEEEYDSIYNDLFEEITLSYADDDGDDGQEDYVEPQDLAREDFEGKTPGDVVKEYLWWIRPSGGGG